MQNHLISSDVNLCKTFKVLLHMKCECCINTDVKKKLFSVKLLFIRSKINFHTYPFWNISWFVAAWIYLLASLCSRATAFVYHIRVSCSKPNWQLLQHSSFMGATTSNVRWENAEQDYNKTGLSVAISPVPPCISVSFLIFHSVSWFLFLFYFNFLTLLSFSGK